MKSMSCEKTVRPIFMLEPPQEGGGQQNRPKPAQNREIKLKSKKLAEADFYCGIKDLTATLQSFFGHYWIFYINSREFVRIRVNSRLAFLCFLGSAVAFYRTLSLDNSRGQTIITSSQ